jgi:hypothetical protein
MGRRARNKQPDPEPLPNPDAPFSARKLGKRKAVLDADDATKRPAKKSRNSASAKEKKVSKARSAVPLALKKGEKVDVSSQNEDSAWSEEDEGWEDVEDDDYLKGQAKCVDLCYTALQF